MQKYFAAEVYDGCLDLNLQIPIEAESLESARTKTEQQCRGTQRRFAGKALGRINKIAEVGQGVYERMNRFAIHRVLER